MVKAKAEITISRIIDIDKVTRYYLLQSSTATAPSKPTSNPPGENWKTTEPSYTPSSTNTLYFVDLTVMTNGSFSYSAVSKSSSYEAAKEAWNKANNAQNTANNAAKTATNYLKGSEDGLVVGNMTDETLGSNVLIDPDSVNIRDGNTILAKYSKKKIELGLNSKDSVIELCGGVGTISSKIDKQNNRFLDISADNVSIDGGYDITLFNSSGSDKGKSVNTQLIINGVHLEDGDEGMFDLSSSIAGGADGVSIHGETTYGKGSYLSINVTGPNKSDPWSNIIISHSPDAGSYQGMEIESPDIIRLTHYKSSVCVGVGVGQGGMNRGIYDDTFGQWMLYCDEKDLYYQAPETSKIRPYYRAGDSIQLYYQGAGFVTSNGQYVVFTIPINKPIDASDVVASSVSGFIGRSNGKYTHGSASSTYVKPASYEAVINGNTVRVSMNFNNNTNVTNNAAIGVTWSGKITFS